MKLFEPIKIGQMELKNRIVMPAMGTGYSNEMGFTTERLKEYLEERAKGGVALIIVECTCIDSRGGKRFWRQLCIDNDKYIPGLYELTEAVHDWGAKIALQLHHAGRLADPAVNEGIQPVSASAIAGYSGITGKEIMARECQTGKVILVMGQEGREKEWETELIVSALPPLPCQRLANELSGRRLDKEIDIHMIGDCLHPRSLYAAIHDGYRIGREV